MKYAKVEVNELRQLIEDAIAYDWIMRDLDPEEREGHDIFLSFSNIEEETEEMLNGYEIEDY